MTDRIEALEQEARILDTPRAVRRRWSERTLNFAESFLEELPSMKAFYEASGSAAPLLDEPISGSGSDMEPLLELVDRSVAQSGLNPASGGHLGYIPGGGLYASALGDFLAAVTNPYAGVFFSSPGAVRMENICIRWLCDLIGYSGRSGGTLTSGGSIANLIALVTARDHAGRRAADFGKSVIYTTRQVHHSAIKAIRFAGLGEATVRTVAMDERYRMIPAELEKQIAADREEGLLPLMVLVSAGTTDLGAVDPLDEVGKICERRKLWMHVDAAYGGAFLLTDYGQQVMKGIQRADSVTIDPHKGLFLPYGSGALLVREVQHLYDSQHMTANYLQDTLKNREELSPADLSPELSRHFRGLRLWLPLKLMGTDPFSAALDEKLLLTRYFYREVSRIPGMEVGPEPELSVLFFRYVPENGDVNRFNRKLIDLIHSDGRVFLSSTDLDGTVYLRLAVLHFRTHLDTIRLTLDILREKIAILESGEPDGE